MQNVKMPLREKFSHKGTFGKVLNFCGSKNYVGAAYLSSLSSLKIGAGVSALSSEECVIKAVSSYLPEVIYFNHKEGLTKLNEFDVVLIGCGLGTSKNSKNLLQKVLNKISPQTPLIIDADGLNLLAQINNQKIIKHENIIITPHPKEASRLLKCNIKDVLKNLEQSARELTKKYNCTTVLKTHRTIICSKDLEFFTNLNGNSALAKSGSGDVLAGIIAGLIAQKMIAYDACKLGVYLHAKSGEIASEELTEYSVLASDLLKFLPEAIKTRIDT